MLLDIGGGGFPERVRKGEESSLPFGKCYTDCSGADARPNIGSDTGTNARACRDTDRSTDGNPYADAEGDDSLGAWFL